MVLSQLNLCPFLALWTWHIWPTGPGRASTQRNHFLFSGSIASFPTFLWTVCYSPIQHRRESSSLVSDTLFMDTERSGGPVWAYFVDNTCIHGINLGRKHPLSKISRLPVAWNIKRCNYSWLQAHSVWKNGHIETYTNVWCAERLKK